MIYFVEDDENIRELVVYTLKNTGFDAKGFEKPSEFYAAANDFLPELILLDIMLPEEDGISILSHLRANERTHDIPVIMLTAKGGEFDKVNALECGADDYITKPFGVMELTARIRALLRRTASRPGSDAAYSYGGISISTSKHTVTVDGQPVELTLKEFELLCYLLENKNIVLTRDKILNCVWGYSFDGENRTVDVHVRTLRRKLGTAGDCIETVRGIGYKIGGAK